MTDRDNWDGTERRKLLQDQQALLVKLVEKVEQLSSKVDATHLSLIESRSELHKLREDFDSHREEETGRINAIVNAFPERDFDEHFDYHEQKRQAAKSWGEIWLEVKKKVVSGVAWAFVLGIALAVWEFLKMELRK